MTTAPAIEMDAVVRCFDEVTALDRVDLRVAPGEVVGLLGHNGAGKTTTVRILAGLLAPDEGRVRVDGRDPMVEGSDVRRMLGVLPARPVVDGRLTARQNLHFAADVFGLPGAGLEDRVEESLARFELSDRAEERVGGFSTGMRQRLSLARVLLPDPPVLLLDEPTSALDPIAARGVRDRLAALARTHRRTIVICTHDLTEAEQLCDRVVVLESGRVVADGSPATLAEEHVRSGIRVDVAVADRDRATGVLTELVGPVAVDEHDGLVVAPVGRADVPEVVRALVAADVDVHEVRRLGATLEEVYFALHGRERRDGPGAAMPAPRSGDRLDGGVA